MFVAEFDRSDKMSGQLSPVFTLTVPWAERRARVAKRAPACYSATSRGCILFRTDLQPHYDECSICLLIDVVRFVSVEISIHVLDGLSGHSVQPLPSSQDVVPGESNA
jgi:hypothetical protein